jgi:uncharacterized protein (TIGR04255 family)
LTERNYEEIFPKNFLKSVACEIRFDPLLSIEEKIPDFQKTVRKSLPAIRREMIYPLPEAFENLSEPHHWYFVSKDGIKKLRIGINSISYAVSKYDHFDPYFAEFIDKFECFFEMNEIDEFSRIGLRYVNVFPLNSLINLDQESILDYFNPIFKSGLIKDLEPFQFNGLIRWKNDEMFLVNRNILKEEEQNLRQYILDIDSYISNAVKSTNLTDIIYKLHKNLIIQFHRGITDHLIETLRRR